ncbi:nucleoside deaminase [Sandaracinus amylolyticus]|uniref:tRNA-specific adenosine-34 deaminase n=1 Tax=Sandaracinus amylolyticus TaxID=927083 RepID=A0A0F6WAP0_9BACT|nr:nucleoside deaminase [Sandaracinus amylolyticus]AKF11692.1 tRNA-specific adenosine-34 deaminase [Sandaracinus amylolyticus]
MREDDERWMRRSFERARAARRAGNTPFGAVLVSRDGELLAEAENTATSDGDPTGHAELNLLRGLFARVGAHRLEGATLYASGEPCPMCAAAIAWAGIPRVVFSVPAARIGAILAGRPGPTFSIGVRDVLAASSIVVRVEGPFLADEGERAMLTT